MTVPEFDAADGGCGPGIHGYLSLADCSVPVADHELTADFRMLAGALGQLLGCTPLSGDVAALVCHYVSGTRFWDDDDGQGAASAERAHVQHVRTTLAKVGELSPPCASLVLDYVGTTHTAVRFEELFAAHVLPLVSLSD